MQWEGKNVLRKEEEWCVVARDGHGLLKKEEY
jgi:hypothetical protein